MPQRATPDLELLHLVTENKGSFWPRKFGLKPSRKLKSACLKETEQMDPSAQIWPVVSVGERRELKILTRYPHR